MLQFFLFCRIFCLTVVLFVWYSDLDAQATGDPKEDFLYGEYYISQGSYREALPFFLSTLESDPSNCNLNYRVGLCYMKQIGEQYKALPYLEKAVNEIIPNYFDGKYKSTGAPGETWILLGDAYLRENRLKEASYAYHKYLELIDKNDKEKFDMITKCIEGLGVSYEFQRNDNDIRLINLGKVINSRFSDYNPVLSGDQKLLIYTQFWESFDKILVSHRTKTGWSVPTEISDQIDLEGECYTSGISYDGTELYLIKQGDFNNDIYISIYKDGSWQKIKPIAGKINTKHQESSVCLSADGNFLYFSSNRPGGEGGFDIYSAERTKQGWDNIVNLGKQINTEKDEEAPYISNDGTVLYFSSNGHETIGNMDIMYSELGATSTWQTPVNIGSPVNTTNDDLFFIYFKNTKTGYLSRDLPEGYGKNDIYMVQTGEMTVFSVEHESEEIRNTASEATNTNVGATESEGTKDINTFKTIQTDKYNPSSELVGPEIEKENINESLVGIGDQLIRGENDSLAVYTIQIYALYKFWDPSKINLSPLKVSKGTDEIYRYTYREYKGLSAALLEIENIRNSGFKDAFIRNIKLISNYSK